MIPNFFTAPLPILVKCKRKAAAGAVCAFGNLDTKANYYMSCTSLNLLKGFHRTGVDLFF
jgi:hypothetical protein